MRSLSELRQSALEILAYAVTELFPRTLLVGGTVTEFGFYYDFIAKQPIDEQALTWLEEKVRGLIKENGEIRILEMMRENAAAFLEHHRQPLRAKSLRRDPQNIVQIFELGKFHDYYPYDSCATPAELVSFKLLKIEETECHLPEEGNVKVVRIHGTVFQNPMDLKRFLKAAQQGKKRDYRLLGKEMDLFGAHEEVNSHAWFWHPKGQRLIEILYDWWSREHRKQNFQLLKTPPLVKSSLIKKAEGSERFHEREALPNDEVEGIEYIIPSTVSPSHALMYHSKRHSYRELPIRYAECAYTKLSQEQAHFSGMRMNLAFADFAHIFCTWEHIEKELISSLQFIDKITKMLGFGCHWKLKGHGRKFAGTLRLWEKSHEYFVNAFNQCSLNFMLDASEPSFTGPKAEACLTDSLGREWKGPSVGLDFNCPERLGLRYQGADDDMHLPLMIVRVLFGSFERFVAILIEHYEGKFPLALAPEQVRVIPVKEANLAYAQSLRKVLEARGYRIGIDEGNTLLGGKIHVAEREKVPYILIVGEREEKQQLITVRSGFTASVQEGLTLEAFLKQLHEEMSFDIR